MRDKVITDYYLGAAEVGVLGDVLDKELIGYKKVYYPSACALNGRTAILKLRIPVGTRVVRNFLLINGKRRFISGKCRASQAVVVAWKPRGHRAWSKKRMHFASHFDWSFCYWVGKTVQPEKSFSTNLHQTCASGIHFFQSRREAEEYSF